MAVTELNRNQLYALKQSYLTDLFYNAGLQPSTVDKLNNHIEIMKKEGFTVDIVETVETADR